MTKKIVLSLTDFEKSNCFAALMCDERILPYLPQGGNQGFREALAPAGTYAPSFTDTYFINLILGALRTIAWCIVAGACRPKQLSPPMGFKRTDAYSSKHCKAKSFQKSYWSASIFLVTAHGFKSAWKGKMLLHATGHKTYYGLLSVIGVGSLSI